MKSGASDPFADDGEDDDHTDADAPEDAANANTDAKETPSSATSSTDASSVLDEIRESSDVATGDSPSNPSTSDPSPEAASPADAAGGTDAPSSGDPTAATDDDGLSRSELPFVLRRDRVKDERPEVHQLFVQRETHDEAVQAERVLQDRLDDDLSRTDAREAIYLAGMSHLDEAESILREWGYDL